MPSTYLQQGFFFKGEILSDLLSDLILLYVLKFLSTELRKKGKIHRY